MNVRLLKDKLAVTNWYEEDKLKLQLLILKFC